MPAERPTSAGPVIRQMFRVAAEGFVPGLRERRVKKRFEDARIKLNDAYSVLGDERGENVTKE